MLRFPKCKITPTVRIFHESPVKTTVDRWSQGGGTIAAIIAEEEHCDLRHEGPSSYCPINHLIRMIIDTLTQNYDDTVINCESRLGAPQPEKNKGRGCHARGTRYDFKEPENSAEAKKDC